MKSNLLRLALLLSPLLAARPRCKRPNHGLAPDSPVLRFAMGKLEAALQQQGDLLKRSTNQAPRQGAKMWSLLIRPR